MGIMNLAKRIAQWGVDEVGGLFGKGASGRITGAGISKTMHNQSNFVAKSLLKEGEKMGLSKAEMETVNRFAESVSAFGKNIDAAKGINGNILHVEDEMFDIIKKGAKYYGQEAATAAMDGSSVRTALSGTQAGAFGNFENIYKNYHHAVSGVGNQLADGEMIKEFLSPEDFYRNIGAGGTSARRMNEIGSIFAGKQGHKRAALAYGTLAVGGRLVSGGSLTKNNDGERDIAGIPFI